MPKVQHHCSNCDAKLKNLLRCSQCQMTYYCSRDCQRHHWKGGHKDSCGTVGSNLLAWLSKGTVPTSVMDALAEGYDDEDYDSDEDEDEEEGLTEQDRFWLTKRKEFLSNPTVPSQNIQSILVDQVVKGTMEAMFCMWSADSVGVQAQEGMETRIKHAQTKAEYILSGLILPVLTSTDDKWQSRRDELLNVCKTLLLQILGLMQRAPHRGEEADVSSLMKHFQAKRFLTEVTHHLWSMVFYDGEIRIDADVYIPIFRKLAMIDCMDRDWNMLGSWDDVLRGLSRKCCPATSVRRIDTDDALEKTTSQLRSARNSMRCKLIDANDDLRRDLGGSAAAFHIFEQPQKWEYQSKCSADGCSRLETPEKPHSYRCTKCWYFHWCCKGCMRYSCDFSRAHSMLCERTPPAKAAITKQDAAGFLGWEIDETSRSCNGCGVKEVDGKLKLSKCRKCGKVWYCSSFCEDWDRSINGGHKRHCK